MVKQKGPIHTCDEELQDRLSELPDCLIHCIMSCLPIGDAVRTSILSKRFRYSWKGTQVLKLDENFNKVFIEGKKFEFCDVLKSISQRLNGPLLECELYSPPSAKTVEIVNGIRVIKAFVFPSAYKYSHLTKLYFYNWWFKDPPSLCVYCNLVSLSLLSVTLNGKSLETMICKTSKIKSLILIDLNITGDNPLVLASPELKMLEYRSSKFSLKLSHLPCLDNATIHSKVELISAKSEGSLFQQFLSLMPKIKELNLGDSALSSLIDRKVPENVRKVSTDSVITPTKLSCAMSLIRTSLNLRKLEFTIEGDNLKTDINKEAELQYKESELLDDIEATYSKCVSSGEYNEVIVTIKEITKTAIAIREKNNNTQPK